jgi:predicted nucleic acid-binding protein
VRVLFDTNVVLDLLLAREPHASTAARLFSLVEGGRIKGSISATTVTTIHYIAAKTVGRTAAQKHLRQLLELFDVVNIDRQTLTGALDLGFPDYEDAVLHEAARRAGMAAIVTRNTRDFRKATLPVLLPSELLATVLALPR